MKKVNCPQKCYPLKYYRLLVNKYIVKEGRHGDGMPYKRLPRPSFIVINGCLINKDIFVVWSTQPFLAKLRQYTKNKRKCVRGLFLPSMELKKERRWF